MLEIYQFLLQNKIEQFKEEPKWFLPSIFRHYCNNCFRPKNSENFITKNINKCYLCDCYLNITLATNINLLYNIDEQYCSKNRKILSTAMFDIVNAYIDPNSFYSCSRKLFVTPNILQINLKEFFKKIDKTIPIELFI